MLKLDRIENEFLERYPDRIVTIDSNRNIEKKYPDICETLPVDMVSVASKAMVEITRLDGL